MINKIFVNDKPLNGKPVDMHWYDTDVIFIGRCIEYNMIDYTFTFTTSFDYPVDIYYDHINGKLLFTDNDTILSYETLSSNIYIKIDDEDSYKITIHILPSPECDPDDIKFPIYEGNQGYLYISDQVPPIKVHIDSDKEDEIISKISALLTPGKLFKYYDSLYSVNNVNYLKGEIYASALSDNYGTVQTAMLDLSNTNWDHITLEDISNEPVIFYNGDQSLGYSNPLGFPPVLVSYNSYRNDFPIYELLKVGAYIRRVSITNNDHSKNIFENTKCTKVYFDKDANKLIFGTDNTLLEDDVCIIIDIQGCVVVIDATYHENEDSKYMEYVDFDIHLIKKENNTFPYITTTRDIKNNCLISYLFIDYDHPPMLVDSNITVEETGKLIELMRIHIGNNFEHDGHNYKMIEKFYMKGLFLIEDLDDNLNSDLVSYKDLIK